MNEKATLTIRVHGEDKTYTLIPPLGYNADPKTGVVRVWDKENTWVVGPESLVALQIPNHLMGRR